MAFDAILLSKSRSTIGLQFVRTDEDFRPSSVKGNYTSPLSHGQLRLFWKEQFMVFKRRVFMSFRNTFSLRIEGRLSVGTYSSPLFSAHLKGKHGLEKVSLNRKFFTCIVILDHSFGLNVF